jgi:hypothetical protein
VVAREEELVKLDGVSLRQGRLPLAGLTAWQGLLEHGGLQSGQRVLILAGAGGVGHLAVQFAAAYGAHVVATASGDNHSFLHRLGASRMVDYHDADWCTRRSPMVRSIWCWIWWGRERQGGAGLRQAGRPSGDGAHHHGPADQGRGGRAASRLSACWSIPIERS